MTWWQLTLALYTTAGLAVSAGSLRHTILYHYLQHVPRSRFKKAHIARHHALIALAWPIKLAQDVRAIYKEDP